MSRVNPDTSYRGLRALTIEHASGARLTMTYHGAHIVSWKCPTVAGDGEMIFVSKKAFFDPPKPIRGGVPVCWPQFAAQGTLAQHGFARNQEFHLHRTEMAEHDTVVVELALNHSAETLALWPYQFRLIVSVALTSHSLSIGLRVNNLDSKPMAFTAALHTYFVVGDVQRVSVDGLSGVRYVDKTQGGRIVTESSPDGMRFVGEVDRVYVQPPKTLTLHAPAAQRDVLVQQTGFPDTVTWNPHAARAATIVDLDKDEWPLFVCVEAAAAATPIALLPGEEWVGTQHLRPSRV